MSKKLILIRIVSIIILSGIAISLIPFIKSLNPSSSAGSGLMRVDISEMSDGELVSIDSGLEGMFGYRYLVARHDGSLYVLGIGTRDGNFVLPWGNLYNLGAYCIEMEINESRILCADTRISDTSFSYEKEQHINIWKYDLQGRNVVREDLSGLEVVPFSFEGSNIVIGRR